MQESGGIDTTGCENSITSALAIFFSESSGDNQTLQSCWFPIGRNIPTEVTALVAGGSAIEAARLQPCASDRGRRTPDL